MQPMIEERNGRRYGRMVTGDDAGASVDEAATGRIYPAPTVGDGGAVEERKARFCAEEDVEILTAVNQMRVQQRRRDAAAAQQKRKAVRKQRIVKAICGLLDIVAGASCSFAALLLLVTRNRLIAVGMLAMAAVYALFVSRLEGK